MLSHRCDGSHTRESDARKPASPKESGLPVLALSLSGDQALPRMRCTLVPHSQWPMATTMPLDQVSCSSTRNST